ncbi:hypothetical protein IP88_12435 [alpha proteobacterium AAP81b]|nr:hypothetical protein IP88_12435 [alpha proteobacterium AAP81b]
MVRRIIRLIALLSLAGALLFGIGIWQAQQDPVLVPYRVTLAGLRAPLTMVQLSDVHVGRDMSPNRVARVVAAINGFKPDVIVLTGDYVSGDPEAWSLAETRDALAPLTDLRAPLGVYAVVGNHDDVARTRWALTGSKITLLNNDSIDIGPLVFVGADDFKGPGRPVEVMRRLVRTEKGDKPVIVLGHRPEFFQWLPERSELMLVGHTHGGQVLLPWATETLMGETMFARRRGVFGNRGQSLIVSSGLGTTFLPVRWGVPPEIVVVSLVPVGYSVGRKSGTDK